VSFCITTVLFAMVYRILPRVWVAWNDVWIGATVTALLFSVGKLAIGLWARNSPGSSRTAAAHARTRHRSRHQISRRVPIAHELRQVVASLYRACSHVSGWRKRTIVRTISSPASNS
jgi:hypothetical protein